MARTPARRSSGPGPVPAVVGGIVAALLLFWVVSIVIGTIVFAVKVGTVIALVAGAFWLYGKFTRD